MVINLNTSSNILQEKKKVLNEFVILLKRVSLYQIIWGIWRGQSSEPKSYHRGYQLSYVTINDITQLNQSKSWQNVIMERYCDRCWSRWELEVRTSPEQQHQVYLRRKLKVRVSHSVKLHLTTPVFCVRFLFSFIRLSLNPWSRLTPGESCDLWPVTKHSPEKEPFNSVTLIETYFTASLEYPK